MVGRIVRRARSRIIGSKIDIRNQICRWEASFRDFGLDLVIPICLRCAPGIRIEDAPLGRINRVISRASRRFVNNSFECAAIGKGLLCSQLGRFAQIIVGVCRNRPSRISLCRCIRFKRSLCFSNDFLVPLSSIDCPATGILCPVRIMTLRS